MKAPLWSPRLARHVASTNNMHAACEQNMAWQRDGLPPLLMAINVSPRQFYSFTGRWSDEWANWQQLPKTCELLILACSSAITSS